MSPYLLRYLVKTPDGGLERLLPDQHQDELPRLGYGVVSEEEYERQKATGMVPIASIEEGFNLGGEWTKAQ